MNGHRIDERTSRLAYLVRQELSRLLHPRTWVKPGLVIGKTLEPTLHGTIASVSRKHRSVMVDQSNGRWRYTLKELRREGWLPVTLMQDVMAGFALDSARRLLPRRVVQTSVREMIARSAAA